MTLLLVSIAAVWIPTTTQQSLFSLSWQHPAQPLLARQGRDSAVISTICLPPQHSQKGFHSDAAGGSKCQGSDRGPAGPRSVRENLAVLPGQRDASSAPPPRPPIDYYGHEPVCGL
ncbi:hypothetical protein BOTBODRAFT_365726 [Botryobasidium botryosum FD-172 SS1]|uniref:Uncharacterized protein n=1 Tax=Botryobasidium botryosum (strain FD-172 SS1) TaxID=930990 RepID=A0A067MP81_BOTB1|nr:hypothetical protein BOTBODRAFT_365726 [Botryobasidium botryosum FD-172 SS1]